MINCGATAVPLRADDLHEYEAAKRGWKKTAPAASDRGALNSSAAGGAQASLATQAAQARKQEVQSRLGLGK